METTKVKEVTVGLWRTGRANFCVSHKEGLTKEQVEVLKALRVGDRLKLWINDDSPIKGRPNFSLGQLVEIREA